MITRNCLIIFSSQDDSRPEWLIPLEKDKLPWPAREAFPRRDPRHLHLARQSGPSQNRIKAGGNTLSTMSEKNRR